MKTLAKCECPSCGQRIEYQSDLADSETPCPGCATPFVLPPPQADFLRVLPEFKDSSFVPEGFAVKKRSSFDPRKTLYWVLAVIGSLAAIYFIAKGSGLAFGAALAAFILTGGVMLGLAVIAGSIYFLPTIVAKNRKHRNSTGVLLVNAAFGWTLIGWMAAMVWAVYEEKK